MSARRANARSGSGGEKEWEAIREANQKLITQLERDAGAWHRARYLDATFRRRDASSASASSRPAFAMRR